MNIQQTQIDGCLAYFTDLSAEDDPTGNETRVSIHSTADEGWVVTITQSGIPPIAFPVAYPNSDSYGMRYRYMDTYLPLMEHAAKQGSPYA